MNMRLYLFLLGRIALLNAAVLGLPLCCALYWGEDTVQAFAIPMAVTLVLGLLLQTAGKQHKKQLGVAEGAWYLVSVWFLLGLIGMMPYVLTGILTPADAFLKVSPRIRRQVFPVWPRDRQRPVPFCSGTA